MNYTYVCAVCALTGLAYCAHAADNKRDDLPLAQVVIQANSTLIMSTAVPSSLAPASFNCYYAPEDPGMETRDVARLKGLINAKLTVQQGGPKVSGWYSASPSTDWPVMYVTLPSTRT